MEKYHRVLNQTASVQILILLLLSMRIENDHIWDAWVARSVEPLTLDGGSGHDLSVGGLSPPWGSTPSVEPA